MARKRSGKAVKKRPTKSRTKRSPSAPGKRSAARTAAAKSRSGRSAGAKTVAAKGRSEQSVAPKTIAARSASARSAATESAAATARSESLADGHRALRERIERERQTAIEQLRLLGISPHTHGEEPRGDADHPRDEGDQAQASERQDLGVLTRERLADRINRLSAALARLHDGTYGQCEVCGGPIEPPRLAVLPDVTTCLSCQRERERAS